VSVSNWTVAESLKAQEIWNEYVRRHDISNKLGQTAGIDPSTGNIWFGKSIEEVIAQRDAEGSAAPLLFQRVGSPTYYRKGGHR
jgi:hypothetical protein